MKIYQTSFLSLRNIAVLLIGIMIVISIIFLVSFSGLVDKLAYYPWSVQLAFVSIAVGIICFSFSPKYLIYVTVFLFLALPGKIFVEPFSLLYKMQGIWLSLFTPADILLIVLGIYSILHLILFKRSHILVFRSEFNILFIFLILLIFSGFLNFSGSEDELFSYSIISAVRIIVLYLSARTFLRDTKDINAFLLALIMGMAVQSIYSLIDFRTDILESAYIVRLGAPGVSVNGIGALSALIIPILISNILFYHHFWRRIFLIICFIVIMGVGILSFSRAGLIGIMFGFIFYMIYFPYMSGRKTFIVIVITSIVLFLLVSQLNMPSFSRIYKIGINDANTLARLSIWSDYIALILRYPHKLLFGYGVFGNRLALGFSFPSFYDHAHNIVIQILFESGIIGLALWSYMIFSILKNLIKISDITDVFLGKGLISGILSFLVSSIFDYTLWEEKVFIIFWSVIIISIRYIEINRFKRDIYIKTTYKKS